MSNPVDEMFTNLMRTAAYVDWQTNPWTGAPLPQPIVGQGSASVTNVPPSPGSIKRGG